MGGGCVEQTQAELPPVDSLPVFVFVFVFVQTALTMTVPNYKLELA